MDNQRKYDCEVMLWEYQKKFENDSVKMERISDDKQVLLSNQVEESKRILVKLMNHLKSIKLLKSNIVNLENEKRENTEAEHELMEVFKGK